MARYALPLELCVLRISGVLGAVARTAGKGGEEEMAMTLNVSALFN